MIDDFIFSEVADSVRSTLEQWLQEYRVDGMSTFGISGNVYLTYLLSVLQMEGSTDRIRFLGGIDLKSYVAGELQK